MNKQNTYKHKDMKNMSRTSKTPYEIRLEALQLAQRTLSEQKAAEAAEHQVNNGADGAVFITSAPSVEEVIEAAERFNKFISDSKD